MSKKKSYQTSKKSPFIFHFNSGSCNGCDMEILTALSPRFDSGRYGALLQTSHHHADLLLATGPVTLREAKTLKKIYNEMSKPKCVIAVGSCGSTGGIFKGLYNVEDGIDNVIPVDVYISGCPPRPDEIIEGIKKAIEILELKREKNVKK